MNSDNYPMKVGLSILLFWFLATLTMELQVFLIRDRRKYSPWKYYVSSGIAHAMAIWISRLE